MEENTQNNFRNGVNGNMQSNLQNDVNNVEYNPNNIQPQKQKKTGLIVLWIILGILALVAK